MGNSSSQFSTRRPRLDSSYSTNNDTAGRGEISRRSSSNSSSRSSSSSSFSPPNMSSKGLVVENPVQKKPSSSSSSYSDSTASTTGNNNGLYKKKYGFIPDNYSTLDQVTAALRGSGLESSNLIIGIDFTKSNEWTGKVSFNKRNLHSIGDTPNPYEKAISVIGKTLAPFDEDNLIPCFGFGDATTHDQEVFSFHSDLSPCHGFEEVLDCYKKVVPNLQLSGPTSYGPVVDAAIDVVERSGGQYHILVIIADGQVTRSVNTNDRELSPQEEKTIKSIVTASEDQKFQLRGHLGQFCSTLNKSLYPISIVLIGVGDGPWEDMRKFDDKIPAREFDNFQFVNFTAIMSKDVSPSEKETAFAVAALMEIPIQYKAATEFGLVGHVTGKAKKIVPRPPPVRNLIVPRPPPVRNLSNSTTDEQNQVCAICLTNVKDMAFGCGHMTCRECGSKVSNCPICRQRINSRLRVYTG